MNKLFPLKDLRLVTNFGGFESSHHGECMASGTVIYHVRETFVTFLQEIVGVFAVDPLGIYHLPSMEPLGTLWILQEHVEKNRTDLFRAKQPNVCAAPRTCAPATPALSTRSVDDLANLQPSQSSKALNRRLKPWGGCSYLLLTSVFVL